MDNSETDKIALERAWADGLMEGNAEWAKCRSVHRVYATADSTIILWESRNNSPKIIDTIVVTTVKADLRYGMALAVDSGARGVLEINQYPNEVSNGVFMWIPAFADVRFTPFPYSAKPDAPRRFSMPMCIKTLGRSDRTLIDRARYATTLQEFRKIWPSAA